MQDLTAKRTLVKSQPELWEEVSEVERLARHLGAFGEIKITKLEAERTVAWEGERASGTVSIEPSGWGTKVTLTAELAENGDPPDQAADAAGLAEPPDEPIPEMNETIDEVPQRRWRAFWSRLFAGWLVPEERLNTVRFEGGAGVEAIARVETVDVAPDCQEPAEPPNDTEVYPAIDHEQARSVLEETLDALGSAHHRPFSRG
jgi:hypothetical protein